MQNFSSDTTGFAALTIVELLIQECVMQDLLDEEAVNRLLGEAARRHENAALGELDKIDMNMEAARLIRTMMVGLRPLFNQIQGTDEEIEEEEASGQT